MRLGSQQSAVARHAPPDPLRTKLFSASPGSASPRPPSQPLAGQVTSVRHTKLRRLVGTSNTARRVVSPARGRSACNVVPVGKDRSAGSQSTGGAAVAGSGWQAEPTVTGAAVTGTGGGAGAGAGAGPGAGDVGGGAEV